ncbi:hypothetical protein L484_011006 [Morus notabilis]|uniref:CLAVATA3/ESR (CLE)-related protein 25 n=1 Tax=Morus notabilis TaxID=981085 RepID=W9REV0_9ROSA|nr:CLAVATA3/ESR (CLE)-related protein 25 [Morus notabilis]EXB74727.1 hypothetical protein L484_011006 [Morus notabilis]
MGSCSSGSISTTSSNINSCFSKDLVRALAIVGLILILLVGTSEGKRATRATATAANFTAGKSSGRFKGTDQAVVGAQKLVNDPKIDGINYMSKRRVPNGPDPIHNRRAGKSGRLPGRA